MSFTKVGIGPAPRPPASPTLAALVEELQEAGKIRGSEIQPLIQSHFREQFVARHDAAVDAAARRLMEELEKEKR